MNENLIWIADDDPIFRLIFKMTVKKVREGLTLLEFENGKLACESLRKAVERQVNVPSFLFMDVNMPEMNGWECLDKIKRMNMGQHPANPRIFIMSSSVNQADEERIRQYSCASGFLRKPISVKKLNEILKA